MLLCRSKAKFARHRIMATTNKDSTMQEPMREILIIVGCIILGAVIGTVLPDAIVNVLVVALLLGGFVLIYIGRRV